MKTPRLALLVLAATLAFSCHAGTNSVEQANLTFPKISAWEFRPDEAVRSANTLIAAGQNSACAALKKFAKAKRDFLTDYEVDQKICHLCRLVFVSRTHAEPLRAPRLGAPELLPLHSMKDSDWPYMPFAIVNDVPLSLTLGYRLEGIAERPEDYLGYCMSNGDFRSTPFPVPTTNTASIALNTILKSQAWATLKWNDSGNGWSYTLDEDYAKEMLWKQLENMANTALEPTPTTR
jgi:hypothetical protein